jgi:hypothetical protein
MVRLSRNTKIRAKSPKRRRAPAVKTGPLKDNLPEGFKLHANALADQQTTFISKIK